MNYNKIYQSLIERAKNRNLQGYKETHHIIPRCIGGSDDKDNLADLTPEEHYLAHQLLVKIYPDNAKIIFAAWMMMPNRPSNKMYGWLKRKFIGSIKEISLAENNSQFGSTWITNGIINKKLKCNDIIPKGWYKGRFIKEKNKYYICCVCKKQFEQNTREIFCSKICKSYYKSPAKKIIDNNLEEMIVYFLKCNSINKTLKTFGVIGERAGNSYFSNLLKQRGIKILKRRNTPL